MANKENFTTPPPRQMSYDELIGHWRNKFPLVGSKDLLNLQNDKSGIWNGNELNNAVADALRKEIQDRQIEITELKNFIDENEPKINLLENSIRARKIELERTRLLDDDTQDKELNELESHMETLTRQLKKTKDSLTVKIVVLQEKQGNLKNEEKKLNEIFLEKLRQNLKKESDLFIQISFALYQQYRNLSIELYKYGLSGGRMIGMMQLCEQIMPLLSELSANLSIERY